MVASQGSTTEPGGVQLALFDFDGTITTTNTFMEFIRYAVGPQRFYLGLAMLAPWILRHYLKVVSAARIKEIFASHFFRGARAADMSATVADFTREYLPTAIRPKAIERLRWHRERGDRVIVVSACIRPWLQVWCDEQGVELIATELEIEGGTVTGRLATANCHGAEKARRIKQAVDLSQVSHVTAYGDSRGDREMLDMADEPCYREFHEVS